MGARFEALCMGVLRAFSDLGCIFFVPYPLDLNNVHLLRKSEGHKDLKISHKQNIDIIQLIFSHVHTYVCPNQICTRP